MYLQEKFKRRTWNVRAIEGHAASAGPVGNPSGLRIPAPVEPEWLGDLVGKIQMAPIIVEQRSLLRRNRVLMPVPGDNPQFAIDALAAILVRRLPRDAVSDFLALQDRGPASVNFAIGPARNVGAEKEMQDIARPAEINH